MRNYFLLFILISLVGCKSSNQIDYASSISSYFKEYAENQALQYGEEYYQKLITIEDTLIQEGLLKGKSEVEYKCLFVKLFQSDTFRASYEPLKELMDYNLYFYYSYCFDIDTIHQNNIPLKAYKKLICKLNYYYDDENLIDMLFVSTDFNNDIMRLNVLIVFLRNLDEKYNEKYKHPSLIHLKDSIP